MILDLHVHTSVGSADSVIDPEDIVQIARQAELDGVCITEHGIRRSELAEKLSRKYNFLVLSGIEATTELGDTLVFGAHMSKQIGCCVTIFAADIRNEADLIRELKRGQCRAVDRRSREQKEPAYWVS